jgi:hypothetical protein
MKKVAMGFLREKEPALIRRRILIVPLRQSSAMVAEFPVIDRWKVEETEKAAFAGRRPGSGGVSRYLYTYSIRPEACLAGRYPP